jgi:hypothetical protein
VDTNSVDSVDTGKGKATTLDAVSASESIELQTRKSLNTPDSSEGMNHGVQERLLGTSDTEVEAVVGAKELPEDLGRAKQIGRESLGLAGNTNTIHKRAIKTRCIYH